jgi:hypothetical protein
VVPAFAVTGALTVPCGFTNSESPGASRPAPPALADGACDAQILQLKTALMLDVAKRAALS